MKKPHLVGAFFTKAAQNLQRIEDNTMQEDPEKRRLMRRRVLKEGKIIINPPSGTLDVKIRDLSENGAKLEVLATTPLPEKFDFIIVADATITPAQVMWRKGNLVGLHFCGDPKKVSLRKI